MVLCWDFFIEAHVANLSLQEGNWHMYSTIDDKEIPNIYLDLAGQTHYVATGYKLMQNHDRLGASDVSQYLYEVVKEFYNRISKDAPRVLDLAEIEATVLPTFWQHWQSVGKIDLDDEW